MGTVANDRKAGSVATLSRSRSRTTSPEACDALSHIRKTLLLMGGGFRALSKDRRVVSIRTSQLSLEFQWQQRRKPIYGPVTNRLWIG